MSAPRKYNKAITGKVIIAFLLACVALYVSWRITTGSVGRMLGTVNQLAEPNPRLQLVNKLFRGVVRLDQLQRTYALQPGITKNPYEAEGAQLQAMLDTLAATTNAADTAQQARIQAMKLLLLQRDKLFTDYLGLTKAYRKNDTLSEQIKTLSTLVNTAARIDSSVITTEQKVTTTTTMLDTPAEGSAGPRQTFWDRLTGRKRSPQARQVQRLIREELNIKIDTLALATEDSVFREISSAISAVDADRSNRRATIINRQRQMTRAGNLLVSQVLSILEELEAAELRITAQNNKTATAAANKGLGQMKLVLVGCVAGAAVLLLLIFTDISRSNTYRKQLVLAKEEAEQLGQVKQRFLANMSHEIRTPLQVIVGVAEQMRMKHHAAEKDIEVVYRSSQHLLQIVNEVLDYSRIVSGKFRFEQQAFDMVALLEEVQDAIAAQVREKGLHFSYEAQIDRRHTCYMGDAFRLKQILYNLLGNAVKFTEHGSVSLLVSQTAVEGGTAFTFTIQDTGAGIAAEDLTRIFNQFEQADESLHPQYGTGLGLSIVRELVEGQQGRISVSSVPGQGSIFAVELVYPQADAQALQAPAATRAIAGHTGLVWLIDDDPLILQICETILNKYQIPHTCFQGGAAALNAPVPDGLTTVFMDIRMPGMDGYELCRLLRARIPASVRIIALTAQVMPDEKDQMLARGFDALLTKPFMEAELLQALRHAQPGVQGEAEANTVHDWQHLRQLTGNDTELLHRLFDSFITETRQDLTALATDMQAAKQDDMAERLHRLAGRCGQFGLEALALRLRAMEARLRQGTYNQNLRPQLEALVADTYRAIDAAVAYNTSLAAGNIPT